MVLLSEQFLESYKSQKYKNAGILFDVVYLRTYSFWLEEKKRRETWLETCRRVVEYSLSLYQGPASANNLQEEAELMFDKMFHLESMPAGRTMRIGGTPACYIYPEMNFNCSGVVIDTFSNLVDLFHLSLCSVGVGYRILKSDVEKLPKLTKKVIVINDQFDPVDPKLRKEITDVLVSPEQGINYSLNVGDSKEGWVESLRIFFRVCQNYSNSEGVQPLTIRINYNNVRPSGERIKTAGGFAAGPEGLAEMYTVLAEIITNCSGKLTPTATMDIANSIAKNVVTGGSRRAAQIALGSPEDGEFLEAKLNLYKQNDSGEWVSDPKKQHRTMSNNSVVFTHNPTFEEVKEIFTRIKNNGEPGFFNLKAARKRRPNAHTINPCSEVIMDNFGVCNLSTVVLPSHIKEGKVDMVSLEKSVRLATRVGMRQTNVTLSLPHWDFVQKRDRLIGPSFTGQMDFLDQLGWEFDSAPAQRLWEAMNYWANDEADIYSYEMRIPRPLLVTVLKPEGSLSQLPTVSSGLHRAYAPYYIRRIKVSETDPVCQALVSLGVPHERDKTKKNSNRLCFSFPIPTGAKQSANDEPAIRQFQRYLLMQELYTDHNSSCTLTVGDDEWEEVTKAVHENFDKVIACAFLSKTLHPFPQMPYEEISREKYEELKSNFPDISNLTEIVNRFENEKTEFCEADMDSCSSGYCPIA